MTDQRHQAPAARGGGPSAAQIARTAAAKLRPQAPVLPDDPNSEDAREKRKEEFQTKVASGEVGEQQQAPGIVDLDEEPDDDGDDEPAQDGDDTSADMPSFLNLPSGFVMPRGQVVWPIRFRAKMTDLPSGPDRWCVLWNLTAGDEKRAAKRAGGDGNRIIDELAKQTIRVVGFVGDAERGVDGVGHAADWSGRLASPGSIDAFWNAIGAKYRHALKGLYLKNHNMSVAENVDFFARCALPRSVG